ncbi:MAG: class I adenylate-forming enzyme family protein [Pseudomonadales bacterium]
MHQSIVQKLICSSCRSCFDPVVVDLRGDEIIAAALCCPSCRVSVPVVEGFALFEEARIWGGESFVEPWLQQLGKDKLDRCEEYEAFLLEKQRRKSTDAYAAFQPFNESSRALYSFIPLLHEVLEPGDIILDTWCRTGWTGELLAGLFPQQRVVSLWEGDSNVLGYKGFAHWLGSQERAPNLEIVFSHPSQPLPFASNSIKVVHGLDSIHRYSQRTFVPECLRVCADDGLLVFPHIHLSNSEPEPYFDRGCSQYHGREWKAWADVLLEGTERTSWLLPEAGLFETESEFVLQDDSNTPHYNGLLLIAGKALDDRKLEAAKYLPIVANSRFVFNPLLNIDLNQGAVSLDKEQLGGYGATMLERHPCYGAYLGRIAQPELHKDEIALLWHARQGKDVAGIVAATDMALIEVMHMAQSLCDRELLHAAPVSAAMAELQGFYSFVTLPSNKTMDFPSLWAGVSEAYGSRPVMHWLQDGSELQAEDVVCLVDATRAALQAQDIHKGERIALASHHHPAALILCWAAWLEGVSVVLIDCKFPMNSVSSLCARTSAKWLFTDDESLAAGMDGCSSVFDSADGEANARSYSSFIEPHMGAVALGAGLLADTEAVVLFSSGSTGEPKAIVLSQQALCLSGHQMAETYSWESERLLSLGPLSMMSGLRNPLVSALASGSTIVLPGKETLTMPLVAWEQAAEQSVTVVTAVPAWVTTLVAIASRLSPMSLLRQILITGAGISATQRDAAMAALKVPVLVYYGLTESGGICIASTDNENEPEGCIGRPVGAVVRIESEDGYTADVGQEGELMVYSDQLMSGYLNDPEESALQIKDRWLHTGDRACWDGSGRVILLGRADELLNLRCGTRLYPVELEQALSALTGVRDAAVTWLEDVQSLVAFVVSDEQPKSLMKELADTVGHLPDRLWLVEGLPYGANGKISRRQLAQLARDNEKDNAHLQGS